MLSTHFDLAPVWELKSQAWNPHQIGRQMIAFDADVLISEPLPTLVVLSTCETGEEHTLREIRQAFYQLFFPENRTTLADLGHYCGDPDALPETLATLRDWGCIPLVLSPSQSLSYSMYLSYCLRERTINFISVDDRPDLYEFHGLAGEDNWLTQVISHTPNYLFSLGLVGYQNYISQPEHLKVLEDFHFDMIRLGQMREKMIRVEPYFRSADFVSFDVSALRMSDFPSSLRPGPNGLYAEEACHLCRFAGLSNTFSGFILSGWNPAQLDSQSAQLVAQMLWHVIDGFVHRVADGVIGNEQDYLVYKVSSEEPAHDLEFYKNRKNGRWWMKVAAPPRKDSVKLRYHIVPCSYDDYEQAVRGELPDTWWNTYQKMG
jgi:hypothetical protein